MGRVNILEQLRRWWKPAEYDEERPVRDDAQQEDKIDFYDRATKFDGYTAGGAPIDPNDAFRH